MRALPQPQKKCMQYSRNVLRPDEIAFDPDHDQVGKPPDLFIRQFSATWDMVPFLNASPAACGGGMLGREHRMPTPGRLFAVLHGIGGTNS